LIALSANTSRSDMFEAIASDHAVYRADAAAPSRGQCR